jgi:signal transduction histidine kinase
VVHRVARGEGMLSGGDGSSRLHREIPSEILVQWQSIVDTMAEITNVPAGLIMRLVGDQIEVCVSSRSIANPYVVGEAEHYAGSGLYCECVIEGGRCLLVPNAYEDPLWQNSPDVPRGMIAYLGFPIQWPNLSPFGTICVLDNKANAFNLLYERLVEQFRDVVEHHLQLITHRGRKRAAASSRAESAAALKFSEGALRASQAKLDRLQRHCTLNQFAGVVFHEMNQPLAAIGLSAAAALRWLGRSEPDVSAAHSAVVRVGDASRRAIEVMAGLGAMASNTTNNVVALDLHVVVREVALMLRDDATRGRVNIQLQLSPEADRVLGNRAQLLLVLHNLARNAIDAMGEVRGRLRELKISARREDAARIQVTVEDNGIGIDIKAMERILQTSFTTKAIRIGSGLSICRAVIEAHGGVISAANRGDGPGASFTFTLPVPDADPGPLRSAAPKVRLPEVVSKFSQRRTAHRS